MVYKIKCGNWNDSIEIGDISEDINGTEIKVISIIKMVSDRGNIFVYVIGVQTDVIK